MEKQKGKFRVVVEEVEKLFKQFQRPNEIHRDMMEGNSYQTSYTLGGCPLDVPAEEVSALGQSNGKSYTLRASVHSAKKPGDRLFNHFDLNLPEKQLAERFSTKKVGEVVFVLDESKKEEFVIHQDSSFFGWLTIEAGGSGGYGSFSSSPKLITTLENFKKDIQKLAEVIETAVNGIYEDFHKESPDVTLYLRPQLMVTEEESILSKLNGGVQKEALKKVIEVENPHVSFADVGGQEGAKREIQGISFALKNPELYKKWGTKPPKGVLLVGPPGTGKTLMAKALASEAQAKFFHVKASDIMSMWYGQSSKIMQAVFDLAREETGPSIIFFDELDALASQRDMSHEASQRIVSTMLENLDGLDSADNIMVVASTNRPEIIDPAVKRPGRIDRIVEVPLPDEQGRRQIFRIHFAKAEKLAERSLLNGVDLDAVVRETEKMSGADISEIVRRTLEEKVRKEGVGEENIELVTTEDITREIKSYERAKKSQQTIGFSAPAQTTAA